MGIMRRFISRPLKLIGRPLKDGKETATQLKSRVRSVFVEMRSNRDPCADGAPDLSRFEELLKHWQIAPEQVPAVIKGLKLRKILYGLMGLFGTYNLIQALYAGSFLFYLTGALLVILGITAWVTTHWRIRVLTEQGFIPFKDWVLGRRDWQ
jgi:hypothetical protein